MSESTPHFAPVVVLLFLGAVLLTGISLVALLYGAMSRSRVILRISAGSMITVVFGYFFLLVGVSLASDEEVLPMGESKYFCEIDCHLAYSLVSARPADVIGQEMQQISAHGRFIVVRLKTWFDERTISPRRGDGFLTPNRRMVELVDAAGRHFRESPQGEAALARLGAKSTPLTEPLRPGQSYTTDLVFDVPSNPGQLRLLVTEADPETRFVIGHENSVLHKKVYFALPEKIAPTHSNR